MQSRVAGHVYFLTLAFLKKEPSPRNRHEGEFLQMRSLYKNRQISMDHNPSL